METRKSPHLPPFGGVMEYTEETQNKLELLAEVNEEAIVYDDIEDALIGYIERCGQPAVAVYDYEKTIECLMRGNDSEDAYEDAVEWYNHNTLGTWVGEHTPVFLHRFEEEEEQQCQFWIKVKAWLTVTANRIMETLRRFGL